MDARECWIVLKGLEQIERWRHSAWQVVIVSDLLPSCDVGFQRR